MDEPLSTASAALGEDLSDPVDLGGSQRSTVLRCRAGDRTVVVKACSPEAFAVEAAGLAFTALTAAGLAPRILAVDHAAHVIVMSDLGTGPSLADLLLGGSAAEAGAGLVAWAQGYGRLAAASVGREPEYAELHASYGGAEPDWPGPPLVEALTAVGLDVPAGLAGELAAVEHAVGPDRYPVFSPGDICPDNNLVTGDGLRILDFEGAGYHSVFRDAAYTTMPFATCWCVYRMPDGVRADVERAYRAEVVPVHPDLADDAVWEEGLRTATVAWTADITAALLETHFANDPPRRPGRRGPSWRQILRYRWEYLDGRLADLPAFAATIESLRMATSGWNVESMPLYPAFQR